MPRIGQNSRREAKLLVGLATSLAVGGCLVVAEHYVLGNLHIARDFAALVLLGVITIVAARFVSTTGLLATMPAVLVFVGVTIINLHNGGLGFPSFFALLLAAQTAFLLRGPTSGLTFTALGLVEMFLLWRIHPDTAAGAAAGAWSATQMMGGGALLLTVSGLTWAYDRLKNDTLRELEAERARADAASRAKSDFLANVSHELRTPMNGVLGALELLEDELDGDPRDLAGVASQSAQSLLRLLDDVLEMSRVEGGAVGIEEVPTDLCRVARASSRMFEGQARRKGLALIVELPESVPLTRTDPLRLQQVLVNLLGNALKFTERGSVRMTLAVEAEPDHLRADVEVRDTGCGIPADQLERIFERFEQVDGSPSRRYGGAGLGLAISRELVTRLGGSLTVDSKIDEGTAFKIALRLALSDAAEDPARTADVPEAPALSAPVLLVEDDAVNRLVCLRMLERLGVEGEAANDGAAALEALKQGDYSLVLMDCQMPVMDGFEATRRIRELPDAKARLPIVALTAQALDEDREACLAAGMDDYLTKPITRAALVQVMERWTHGAASAEATPDAPPR